MWSSGASSALRRTVTTDERRKFFESVELSPTGRRLLTDRRAPFEHFYLKNLLLSACHAAAFTAAPALAAATPGPEADDEDELLDWDKLAEELKDFKQRALAMLIRVLGCTSLKRVLEAACVRHCATPTADALLKDAAKSAVRKAARHGRLGAGRRMVETAALSSGLGYLSNWLVEEACFGAQYIRERRRDPSAEAAHRRKWKRQSANAVLGYGAAYALATVGMALGTVVKPGWGTIVGGAAGDLVGILLL